MFKKILSKNNAPIIARILLINVIVLAVLHFIAVAIELYAPNHSLTNYTYLFDLDREYNVPTFYSGILLLTIAIVAWNLRSEASRLFHKFFWAGLAVFFTYWAIDEVLVLHERSARPVREILQIGYDSMFYHAWVVIAMGLIGLLGIFVLIFHHLKMPPLTKKQSSILVVVLIFMSGIVLLEILGTKIYGNPGLYRFVMIPLEELFEIGMGSYLLVKLLNYQK